jgi:hypothetical protein
MQGKCPSSVTPIFFGGRLLALQKKLGGIRPIAIGYSLRRLAAKCVSKYALNILKDTFTAWCWGIWWLRGSDPCHSPILAKYAG